MTLSYFPTLQPLVNHCLLLESFIFPYKGVLSEQKHKSIPYTYFQVTLSKTYTTNATKKIIRALRDCHNLKK